MTRDDIIKLAREAGMLDFSEPSDADLLLGELERFAALVAAAERRKHQADIERWKEAAVTAEKWRGMALSKDGDERTVQRIQQEAAAAEREACAAIAEAERAAEFRQPVSAHRAGQYEMAEYIYEAIRARGQA